MTDKPNPPLCVNCKHFNAKIGANYAECKNNAAGIFSPVFGTRALMAYEARGLAPYSKCGPDGVLFEQHDDSARELRFGWRWLWRFICLFRRKA